MDATNEFYLAAANKMLAQIQYLEKLVGRELTLHERDNIHDFFLELDTTTQDKFESECGPLL
jgi:hypothetical protein